MKTIVHNAGENGSLAVAEILDSKAKNFGYDALNKKCAQPPDIDTRASSESA